MEASLSAFGQPTGRASLIFPPLFSSLCAGLCARRCAAAAAAAFCLRREKPLGRAPAALYNAFKSRPGRHPLESARANSWCGPPFCSPILLRTTIGRPAINQHVNKPVSPPSSSSTFTSTSARQARPSTLAGYSRPSSLGQFAALPHSSARASTFQYRQPARFRPAETRARRRINHGAAARSPGQSCRPNESRRGPPLIPARAPLARSPPPPPNAAALRQPGGQPAPPAAGPSDGGANLAAPNRDYWPARCGATL